MAGDSKKSNRLRVRRVLDMPLREVSGICLRRGRSGQMSLVGVGDRAAKVAWTYMPTGDDWSPEWQIADISGVAGSDIPKDDPQLEAVCADGAGRVLLLQESPPRAELVDPEARRVVASITLEVEGDGNLARSWTDPEGSRGEGAVLLAGGHLLIAKEKQPNVFVEFGPAGSRSVGFAQGGALGEGAAWPIEPGRHRYVALAVWRPDKLLDEACVDFSDLEIGPDGRLYVLSDQSATIAQIETLEPEGGKASLAKSWKLDDDDAKSEGLTFAATGHAIVAMDKRKKSNNLIVLEPAIAAATASGGKRN
jgi:hypothetical protein